MAVVTRTAGRREPLAGDEPIAPVTRQSDPRPAISAHRRFALREVTLGGYAVGGATVDVWQDASGADRWSARALVPLSLPIRRGSLAGTAQGGQRFCGTVQVGDTSAGPRRGREVLAELLGDGPLSVQDALAAVPDHRRGARSK
ncbi:MAG TPA: hypothetical protein VKR30_02885 [Candidatus Limnocylindrales bacterium]|nr:hypothetical protein [Candidatus Limnocylindrales bacterium]